MVYRGPVTAEDYGASSGKLAEKKSLTAHRGWAGAANKFSTAHRGRVTAETNCTSGLDGFSKHVLNCTPGRVTAETDGTPWLGHFFNNCFNCIPRLGSNQG